MPLEKSISQNVRKLLSFGFGIGLEIGATDLEVVAARVRPNGVHVLGRLVIANYATRPAAEWGAEYSHFLKSLGVAHLSATVLLPRREVVVRQVALPGVAPKDIDGAIRFQLDSLHPYGDEEVCSGWSPLSYGAVLVGIARKSVVERYAQLFSEAGIAASSFTFSAAALHAAIRLDGHDHSAGFVALGPTAAGAVEVYGESASRPLFWSEFDLPAARATTLALAELRLAPETEPLTLPAVLPRPKANPADNDLSRNARPYAAALAGACPRLAPAANVLPPELRHMSSRTVFIPTIVLAAIVVLTAIGMLVYTRYAEHQYLLQLEKEIARIEPQASRAASLEKETDNLRVRAKLIEQYRAMTRYDLDTLNELTRLVEAPAWSNNIEFDRDQVRFSGEAAQPTAMVKLLDSSPFFKNTNLDQDVRTPAGVDNFTIHASRGGRP